LLRAYNRNVLKALLLVSRVNINSSGGNNFAVSNNYIGGTASNAGSTAWTQTGAFSHTFTGIRMIVGTAVASGVQGNIIKNISVSTAAVNALTGFISASSGSVNIGTITGNTIGSTSSTGSIVYNSTGSGSQLSGILANGYSVASFVNISNNNISGITMGGSGTTAFRGIFLQGAVTKYTVYKNLIGSETTANSISNSTNAITNGIGSLSTSTVNNILENTIANLDASNSGTAVYLYGISVQFGVNNISGNTIRNFTSTSTYGGQSVIGINFTVINTPNQVISKNTIYSLANNNTSRNSKTICTPAR